jgi:hypothetical protein
LSLDVYLQVGGERFESCQHCDGTGKVNRGRETVHDANITHNMGRMAEAAGIYEHLWRPDEIGVTKAGQLVGPLRAGLARLKADPERFEKFNPENKWGDYGALVRFVEKYLIACEEYPDADVSVSR